MQLTAEIQLSVEIQLTAEIQLAVEMQLTAEIQLEDQCSQHNQFYSLLNLFSESAGMGWVLALQIFDFVDNDNC